MVPNRVSRQGGVQRAVAGLMAWIYLASLGCGPGSIGHVPWAHPRSRTTPVLTATDTVLGSAVDLSIGTSGVTSDGAATYEIPIWVPPGRRGIQPNLALLYNSRGGNGLLGVGWQLKGFSIISRCRKTIAQDGETKEIEFTTGAAGSRFCLDGQRLTAASGTYGENGAEYRTEHETFVKVVSIGSDPLGPKYFKVYLKNGQIL